MKKAIDKELKRWCEECRKSGKEPSMEELSRKYDEICSRYERNERLAYAGRY